MIAIELREVVEADLPALFEHQMDPEANRMAAFPARERDAFFAHWKTNILGDRSVIARTILSEGLVVGNIGCFEKNGRWLIGYWIGRSHWGKGIATEALGKFLTQVERRPLHAYVATHNLGSIRVLQKCGFTIRGHEICPPDENGEVIEEYLMELS